MEGHDLFDRLDRVKAPEGFEDRVLARLPEARRARHAHQVHLRFAYGGAGAAVLACAVLVNVFVLQKPGSDTYAARPGVPIFTERGPATDLGPSAARTESGFTPMLERVDYSSEIRNVSYEPRTVYILEQVSEGPPSGVKF